MSNTDSGLDLSLAATRTLLRSIEDRTRRLVRCRVTLEVEVSKAYRSLPLGRRATERCRIVFQRATEAAWQVTAFDAQGTTLCDAVRDGRWIEVDGKCWHSGYNEFFYGEKDEIDAPPAPPCEEAREALLSELRERLWALTIATGHHWTDSEFITRQHWRTVWQFRQQPEEGILVGHSRFDYQPGEHRFSFSEWMRWRFACLCRGSVEIEDYYGRCSVPTKQGVIVLDERLGLAPHRLHMVELEKDSAIPINGDVWEDYIPVGDGQFIASKHKVLGSASGDGVLLRSTLIPDESAFGVNIPLNLRPLDRTTERVDW